MRRDLAEPKALALMAKGREQRDAGAGNGHWYFRRARGLRRHVEDKLDTCGIGDRGGPAHIVVECACGPMIVPLQCKQRLLCQACGRKTYGRMRKRVEEALTAHIHTAERAGNRRRPYLLTLTVRHSGDLDRDRQRIQAAWEKLRKWCWRRLGQFTFVMVWEATPGRRHDGHVHAHAVVLWDYLPWKQVQREWRRALDDESARLHISTKVESAEEAAFYIAKYVSKGVEAGVFSAELAARVVDSMYARRLATTSHDFWLPKQCACKKCGAKYKLVEPSLHTTAPRIPWSVVELPWFAPDDSLEFVPFG